MLKRGRIGLDRNYFVWPHPFWMIVLGPSVAFIVVTAVSPDFVPSSLGIIRTASFYVYENFPYITWLTAVAVVTAHIFECIYTIKLCYDADMTVTATIKWTISTLFFGFASILLRLKPYLQKAKRSQF